MYQLNLIYIFFFYLSWSVMSARTWISKWSYGPVRPHRPLQKISYFCEIKPKKEQLVCCLNLCNQFKWNECQNLHDQPRWQIFRPRFYYLQTLHFFFFWLKSLDTAWGAIRSTVQITYKTTGPTILNSGLKQPASTRGRWLK